MTVIFSSMVSTISAVAANVEVISMEYWPISSPVGSHCSVSGVFLCIRGLFKVNGASVWPVALTVNRQVIISA